MVSAPVRPVILSGGAGTRLWPLSTGETPKQFVDLLGPSLFEATLQRLAALPGAVPPVVVTGARHQARVSMAAEEAGVEIGRLIVEPVGRNTAPAIAAAALLSAPDEVLVVLPSDHVITEAQRFAEAVAIAVGAAAEGALVLFGVRPSRPDTGYGYIEVVAGTGTMLEVAAFREKPGEPEARALVEAGHLWNSGMFVFRAGAILDELRGLQPGMVAAVEAAIPAAPGRVVELLESFGEAEAISIDHAVMEHTGRARALPVDFGWSDVGSWQAVWELAPRDRDGNVIVGEVVAMGVTDSYLRSSGRPLAVIGMDGVVVVESDEGVLVVPKSMSQAVRDAAAGFGVADGPR